MLVGVLVWILVSVPFLVALVRSATLIVVAMIGGRTMIWLRGSSPVVDAHGSRVMATSSSSYGLLVWLFFDQIAMAWLHRVVCRELFLHELLLLLLCLWSVVPDFLTRVLEAVTFLRASKMLLLRVISISTRHWFAHELAILLSPMKVIVTFLLILIWCISTKIWLLGMFFIKLLFFTPVSGTLCLHHSWGGHSLIVLPVPTSSSSWPELVFIWILATLREIWGPWLPLTQRSGLKPAELLLPTHLSLSCRLVKVTIFRRLKAALTLLVKVGIRWHGLTRHALLRRTHRTGHLETWLSLGRRPLLEAWWIYRFLPFHAFQIAWGRIIRQALPWLSEHSPAELLALDLSVDFVCQLADVLAKHWLLSQLLGVVLLDVL